MKKAPHWGAFLLLFEMSSTKAPSPPHSVEREGREPSLTQKFFGVRDVAVDLLDVIQILEGFNELADVLRRFKVHLGLRARVHGYLGVVRFEPLGAQRIDHLTEAVVGRGDDEERTVVLALHILGARFKSDLDERVFVDTRSEEDFTTLTK